MIGIFKRKQDNLYGAIYSRDGLKSGIEGYVYDLNFSFKGDYHKHMVSDFNIPVELNDPNLKIILKDIEEKVKILKYPKRVIKMKKLLDLYKNKVIEKIKIEENDGFIYFLGNRLEINKFSFYDNKTNIAIIDGIKVELDIPPEVIEYLKNKKTSF